MANNSSLKSDEIRKFVKKFAPSDRTLEGRLLAGAEEIEMTASNPLNELEPDRVATTRIPILKEFVRRNHTKDVVLRVRAGPIITQKVRSTLGSEDLYIRATPGQKIGLQELNPNIRGRNVMFVFSGDIYVWNSITIRWPRDPGGRSTVRGGLLLLNSTP